MVRIPQEFLIVSDRRQFGDDSSIEHEYPESDLDLGFVLHTDSEGTEMSHHQEWGTPGVTERDQDRKHR
jgi:hypothetical protein